MSPIWRLLIPILPVIPLAAAGQSLTIQGRVTNAQGQPIIGNATKFRVQLYSPDPAVHCVIYDETHVVDMSVTGGLFSLNLGDVNPSRISRDEPDDLPLENALSNRKTIQVPGTFCTPAISGTANYVPDPKDGRKVEIQFNDPSTMGSHWEKIPKMDLNPAAYAMESRTVGGFPARTVLRVVDGNGDPANFNAFTLTEANELQSLAAGSSTRYVSRSATAGLQLPGAAPAVPAAGSIWFEGGNLKYSDGINPPHTLGNASAGTITGISAGTGLSGGGTTGTVTLGLAASGVGAGATRGDATHVPRIQYDTYGRITGISEVAITGTLPGAGTAGQILKSDGSGWTNDVLRTTDLKSTSDQGSIFPAAPCTSGQTLYWNSISDKFACQAITLSAPSATVAASYKLVTVAADGRVNGGSSPTTLGGFGISDGLLNTNGVTSVESGGDTGKGAAGAVDGRLYFATDTKKIYRSGAGAWADITPAAGGGTLTDVLAGAALSRTASGSTVTLNLPTIGAVTNVTKVTTDAYGRVTSGSALADTDIPNLDWTKITSGKPTSLLGYGINDKLLKNSDGSVPNILSGDEVDLPTADSSNLNHLYIANNTKKIFRQIAGSWEVIGAAPGAGFTGSLAGEVTGTQGATQVASINGISRAAIKTTADTVSSATELNTATTLVKRDGNGDFAGRNLTASQLQFKDGASNTVNLRAASASAAYSLQFPSTAPSAGQSLQSDASGVLTWVTAAAGSLSNVLAGNGISVTGTGATRTVALTDTLVSAATNVGSATSVPTISVDQQGRITAISSTPISGIAPSGTASGDLSDSYPNPTVSKIQHVSVSSVAPSPSQILKYVSSAWTASTLELNDLKANDGVTSSVASANCTAGKTLFYEVSTKSLKCQDISIAAATQLTGTLPIANGGTGLTAAGTANQVLGVTNASGALEYKTITAGTGITVAHSAGAITINSTASGGTVTGVTAGTGLSGGTINTSGTIALASIANNTLLANVSGSSAVPTATSVTSLLDSISNTQGSILYRNASGWTSLAPGTSGQFLKTQGSSANPVWDSVGGGSLSNIDVAAPYMTSSGALTSNGTITLSYNNQTAASVLAGPTTGSAAPTFRALAATDIPNLSAAKITSGSLGIANGGTGLTAAGTANQVLGVANAGGVLEYKTITAGSGITVAHSAGGITINSTAGGGTVTGVTAGTGLSGGTINSSGTIALASIANNTLLANVSGSSAVPTATSLTNLLDSVSSTQGAILYRSASGWTSLAPGTSGQFLKTQGSSANPVWDSVGGGSISNIDVAAPFMTSSGALTSNGTITLSYANQTAGLVLAGPATGSAAPTFRALAATDIPNFSAAKITSGSLAPANGGTGLTALGTANQLLGVNAGATAAEYKSLVAGTGVTITHGAGTVTIDATGGTGTLGGDATGASTANTVTALRNVPVSSTSPGMGNVLRYASSTWSPSFLQIDDIKTDATGTANIVANATCSAGQMLIYASGTKDFRCQAFAGIPASAISSGTIDAARLPVASATSDGIINQIAQSIKGAKTFLDTAFFSNGINVTGNAAVSGNVTANLAIVNGVKVGNVATGCDGTTEGTIRYNSASKKMEFCDGSNWKNISASVNASVVLSSPSNSLVKTGPVTFTVTYGSGTDTNSISLNSGNIAIGGTAIAGCTVTGVTGSGSTRTVTVDNCTGTGTVNISVAANTAQSTTGEPAAAAGPSTAYNVDNAGPTAPSSLSLGSVPNSLSLSPTITYVPASDVGGSTVANHQVRIERASDNSVAYSWANHSSGSAVSGLTLQQNTGYNVYVRAVDNFGNIGSVGGPALWTTVAELYPFASHTFTSCGNTGNAGPAQANCRSAYGTVWDEDDANYTVSGGIQKWTVPKSATYRITAAGAEGGDKTGNVESPGKGATISSEFDLTQGEIINIVVGQKGGTNSGGSGGGGGSFVWREAAGRSVDPLIVGGGGGGDTSNNSTSYNGLPGNYTTSGTRQGGSSGSGGASNSAGAGAGWLSNGAYGATSTAGGKFSTFVGGTDGTGGSGGFGGGGAGTSAFGTGGGGAGYSGGGCGINGDRMGGGGGGSFSSGTNRVNINQTNTGPGFVLIEQL